jgi:energy-coupling factor transporter ATP-binding protein EcfA2
MSKKPKRIEKITLRHFRGATKETELPLDADMPIVMIFGENGTGKSTILDAIDMVCNKSIGSIGERSSINAKLHLPALGRAANDVEVSVTYDGETWTGTLSGKNIVVKGSEPRPTAHILRRSQLLRLVEAAPSERYNELKSFIDVGGVESGEQALKNAERTASNRLKELIRLKQADEDALQELWEAEGRPGAPHGTASDWATEKAAADTAATRRIVDDARQLIEQLDAAQAAREAYRQARSRLSDSEARLNSLQRAARGGQAEGAGSGLRLINLLRQAQAYIAPPHAEDECPVCRRPDDIEKLRGEIAERLAAMTELDALNNDMSAARKARETAEAACGECRAKLLGAVRALARTAEQSRLPPIADLRVDWVKYGPLLSSPDAGSGQEGELRQAESLSDELSAARAALVKVKEHAQKDVHQFNAIKGHCERIREGHREIVELNEVQERLKEALGVVRAARIAFTQEVLDEVKEECCRLYERIHPDEPLGLMRFRLDEKHKGSLYQDASFQGYVDVPPQAYFSESHLDTLGFCLFLAISKLSCQGDSIIILDDVFTSVDARHLFRIADLLIEESECFNQIIISTHNRHWFDRHRFNQLPEGRACLVELDHRWTHEHGISVQKGRLVADELADKLREPRFDRQGVAGLAGVLLESVLDHLTLVYRCGMPRTQSGEYTLGELSDGVKKYAKDLEVRRKKRDEKGALKKPEEAERIPLKPMLEAVGKLKTIRNQVGAHFNSSGAEISSDEVEQMGRQAVALVSALACPRCGEMPRKDVDTHLRCTCGDTQMVSPKSLWAAGQAGN